MVVAITGGTGFIGKRLVKRCLSNGDEVRILSRKEPHAQFVSDGVHWFQGDLTREDRLDAFLQDVDVLYHCAGQLTKPEEMHQVHVKGTEHLIAAAEGRIAHWVQLSSVGVYGSISSGLVTEDSPIEPVGEYEITKAMSDAKVLAASERGAFACTILRPSNVFGADMSNQSLFSMINMIDRGLFFFIGKPGASANYIHVDNVVSGLLGCAAKGVSNHRIYNLSDYCLMEEFVQFICVALGNRKLPRLRLPEYLMRCLSKSIGRIPRIPLTIARVNALTNRSVYSIERIQTELDYQHITSQQEGIAQMVAMYKKRSIG